MNEQAADPLHNEKESFKSIAKKLEHVHLASTIKLNVGGQYFTTSLQTLTKDKGSMLHAMFSGRFDTKPAEDGSYFIDRDGTHFRYILNYLRTGRLLFPKDDQLIREELLEEAEFYKIHGILEELRHPPNQPFKDSTILSTEHKQVLINNFLKKQLSDESNFVLIYRASRDGWHSSKFHALCDDKGPTVTVVKNGNNIFGGYTEMSWEDGTGQYKCCRDSFLFSLVNPSGTGPIKMPLRGTSNHNGILCNRSFGPIFGGGHDLLISNEPNANSDSTTKLGHTYRCPDDANCSFLTGLSDFVVNELEVFMYQP